MITLIAALDEHGLIGAGGTLPWSIKSEMAHFRQTTAGHTVLMGRRTYDSIGGPLPNRRNIVLTSRPLVAANVEVITNIDTFLSSWPQEVELFVIGGAKVYQSAMKYADRLVLSTVKGVYVGDTYFPRIPAEFTAEESVAHDEFSVTYYVKKAS